MKQPDHRDQAEQQLEYADTQITGNAEAMLQSAYAHALIALIDSIDTLTYYMAVVLVADAE